MKKASPMGWLSGHARPEGLAPPLRSAGGTCRTLARVVRREGLAARRCRLGESRLARREITTRSALVAASEAATGRIAKARLATIAIGIATRAETPLVTAGGCAPLGATVTTEATAVTVTEGRTVAAERGAVCTATTKAATVSEGGTVVPAITATEATPITAAEAAAVVEARAVGIATGRLAVAAKAATTALIAAGAATATTEVLAPTLRGALLRLQPGNHFRLELLAAVAFDVEDTAAVAELRKRDG